MERRVIPRLFEQYEVSPFFGTITTIPLTHNGELSDWFDVTSGTGQGDIQGPPIFNVCLNLAAQRAEEKNGSIG